MSLDYTLNIATDVSPEKIAALLAFTTGLREDGVDLWGGAVNARVIRKTGLGQEIVEETFGFRPTIAVVFHVIPSEGYDTGLSGVARAVAQALRCLPGDAVLLKSGELMMLQRRSDEVVISDEWVGRLAPELKLAGVVFERQEREVTAA